MKGFVDWLRGPDAAEQFRARGMMLVAETPGAGRGRRPLGRRRI